MNDTEHLGDREDCRYCRDGKPHTVRGKPEAVSKLKAQAERKCCGNGSVALRAHALSCTMTINPGDTFWSVRWPKGTAPRQTEHCAACHDHYIRQSDTTPF